MSIFVHNPIAYSSINALESCRHVNFELAKCATFFCDMLQHCSSFVATGKIANIFNLFRGLKKNCIHDFARLRKEKWLSIKSKCTASMHISEDNEPSWRHFNAYHLFAFSHL